MLPVAERGERHGSARGGHHPLRLDAAGEPPGTDAVLPSQSAVRAERGDVGRLGRRLVQDPHHDADDRCQQADDLAWAEYVVFSCPLVPKTYLTTWFTLYLPS